MNARPRRLALAAAFAGVAVAVPSAQAAPLLGICPGQQFSQPFAALGDTAPYTLVPGGDFESGAIGWRGTGAAVTADAGHTLGMAADGYALSLPAGASVVSPAVCVTADYPYMRFVARSASASAASRLSVEVLYDNGGPIQVVPVAELTGARMSDWGATPRLRTGVLLGTVSGALGGLTRLRLSGAGELRLRITATGGAWRIDDVHVDPKMR
ncbi:MAG: hypothetical protein IT200_11420 [Thermoleophilia bacterium]|nr:hypothetical protein [Thermoleophilia bacterium]